MGDPQELHSYAEVAITLAGLTGIVGAIQKRSGAGLTKREIVHIANLVMLATLTVLLAFIPTVVSRLPIDSGTIWTHSVSVMFVFHLLGWFTFGVFSSRGRIVFDDLPRVEKNVCLALLTFGAVTLFSEMTIVLGFFTEFAAFIYEFVLLLFLGSGLYNFVSLLLGVREDAAQPEDK